MMYASKITVDHNPKKISKNITKSLGYDGNLTIAFLKDLGIGDNDEFCVYEDENSRETFISYDISRLETQEEVNIRVAKEIKYNENYEKHHAKYGKK